MHWIKQSATQGLADAQLNLGDLYSSGLGVDKDYKESARWYRSAAEQSDAVAQLLLALMYEQCKGVEQNYELAYMWFALSAAQDNKESAENLVLYETQLSSQQVTNAKRLANECQSRDYKNCD